MRLQTRQLKGSPGHFCTGTQLSTDADAGRLDSGPDVDANARVCANAKLYARAKLYTSADARLLSAAYYQESYRRDSYSKRKLHVCNAL